MSKKTGVLALVVILALLGAVVHAVWWKHGKPEQGGTTGPEANHSISNRPGKTGSGSGPDREEAGEWFDPLKVIDEFDMRFSELRQADGEAWTYGIQDLAVMTNILGKQGDFRSVVASALMAGRVSDMAIARMMAGEVSPEGTLRGLKSFSYRIPNDQQLIDFICEYHPSGKEERLRNPSESVLDFAFRFEPDLSFPEEAQNLGKTPTEIIAGQNMIDSLLAISIGETKLETARTTAIYLQRGGNRNFSGDELRIDLEMRVGKEIAEFPTPLFGEDEPNSYGIVFFIEMARMNY